MATILIVDDRLANRECLTTPTMDGYAFVRQLRTDAAIAATPVIGSTAHYHEREVRSLPTTCGVFHVLTKPRPPPKEKDA